MCGTPHDGDRYGRIAHSRSRIADASQSCASSERDNALVFLFASVLAITAQPTAPDGMRDRRTRNDDPTDPSRRLPQPNR